MQFPFRTELRIGDITIAELEGHILLEPDPAGCSPYADHADWFASELHIMGTTGKGSDRELAEAHLPDDDPMHDRLLAAILNEYRPRIDAAWAKHMRQAIEASRARFTIVAANA